MIPAKQPISVSQEGRHLLIADKLADYQMNYLAEHAQTQKAEVRQISGRGRNNHTASNVLYDI